MYTIKKCAIIEQMCNHWTKEWEVFTLTRVLAYWRTDVNAITRIHDSLTFLGATWVGHEMALYLELDQCSNSRTHQDFAPNQSSYGSPYIVKWNQQQRMKNKIKTTEQNWKGKLLHCTEMKTKLENKNTIGENEWKHLSMEATE